MNQPTHLYAFVQRNASKPYVYGLSLDPGKNKTWYLLQEDESVIENHAEIEAAIPNKKKFLEDNHIRTTPLLLDDKTRKKYLTTDNQLQFRRRVLMPETDTTAETSIAYVLSHLDNTIPASKSHANLQVWFWKLKVSNFLSF